MSKKIINIFFLVIFLVFLILISKYYFSEKNIISTNKLRSSYSTMSYDNNNNLPILKNDTKNIIIYIDDMENFKKKRKKRFWEKLISDNNE